MRKLYFLGSGAAWTTRDVWRHFFAFGTNNDNKKLEGYLLEKYCGKAVALCTSGRAALYMALKKLIPEGSKVVVNGLTCDAVLDAIRKSKNVPIFADATKENLHFSINELKKVCRKYQGIKAVIVQNTLGYPVDIAPIEKFCKDKGIILIEDMAHATGRFYDDGREIGAVGDATVFSFGKSKTIDTISGGAVVFRGENAPTVLVGRLTAKNRKHASLRERLYPFFSVMIRHSYRLKMQKLVAGGLIKLHLIERSADAKLDERAMTNWQAKLALKQFKNIEKYGTNFPSKNAKSKKAGVLREFYLVDDRDMVLSKLREAGFYFDEVWYDVPIIPARRYKKQHFPEKECPVATELAKHLVNLPTWYSKSELKKAKEIIMGGVKEEDA